MAFAEHDYLLTHDPARAHWNAAVVAMSFGSLLSIARGSVAAFTNPPGQRWAIFIFVTRGVAPLYIVPFVMGTQWDCYQAAWAKRSPNARPHTATLGGAEDLG